MKLAIETGDDLPPPELPSTHFVAVDEKQMIAGDSDEETGDECDDDEQRRGGAGINRRH
jgi:hypothetical protein